MDNWAVLGDPYASFVSMTNYQPLGPCLVVYLDFGWVGGGGGGGTPTTFISQLVSVIKSARLPPPPHSLLYASGPVA